MKITNKIILTISFITGISMITIIAAAIKVGKLAKDLDVSAQNTYISCAVGIILMEIVAVLATVMFRKDLQKHIDRLEDYSEHIASGDVDFEVELDDAADFEPVYKAYSRILAVNKEEAELAEAVAKGDLTVNFKAKGDRDKLGQAMTHLLKSNNEVLSGIQESSYQLTTGAEQVAAASQALAQGSTEQASAIEQVTVSMKEIANMTKNNAENANKANEIVQNTKAAAELGNNKMDEMKNAMGDINDSSEKIGKIIKVIDDISFQTNILALNAAVEAARAGEHGKGFAVVAEQIRELAGKSAQAAAETADMIDDSITKVHVGTKLAEETASALDEIVNDIDSVADITASISKASDEQATAVVQIEQAVEQVSQVVQTNSATSEECAAASEELSGQSLSLREMIGRYKLSGNSSSNLSMAKNTNYNSYSNYSGANDGGDVSRSFSSKVDPESIISLDGDFGKY